MSAPLPPDRWARVEELFDRAMERPASERQAFITSACGDDDALRAEVESLLAASEDGISRRVSAVDRVASDLMTSTGSTVPGMRLGPWRLEEEVGRGGMGVVYRAARDDGEFEQTAAVKVLPGALFSPDTAARFRNERRILAGLEHPNVARLLDGGTTGEGVPWVVMEYVDGVPVDRYVEREGLSLENRIWLFLAVCDAVRYAHRNLVVHRDLKPSNILVTEDGTPKLLDFGIATLLNPEAQDEATGTRIMTPRFASPEQLLGLRIGTPSDVYSLGLVLYRILAGTDARSTETGASLGDAELLRQTLDRDPPPPSAAAGDTRLKGDLDTIVLTALRRDPEDRYESAGALADDLERYLAGLPIRARRPTVGYRFRKFVGRNRGAVAAASVALVLAGAQTVLFMNRLADERDRAREEAERATRTLDFLTDLFAGANPWESGRSDLTARELLGRGVSRLEVGLADQPEIRAGILSAVGKAYDALGVADSADVLLSRSVALHETTFGPDAPETARALVALGNLYTDWERRDEADSLLRRALAIQRARLPPEDPDIARTLSQMAYEAHMGGEFATADTLLLQAQEILDASPDGGDRELRAGLLRSRAGALIELRRLEEADSALHASLEIREADLGRRHPAVASTLDQIARLRELQGRFRESEALYRETIDWGTELLGEDHQQVTTWYNNLASVVRGMERNEEALEIQEMVVERRRREFPEGHLLLAGALNNVGNMYGNLGRFEEADAAFEEGRAVLERIHGDDHPLGATMLNNQATLAWRQGNHDRAVELSTRVLELDRRQLGPRHEYIATDLTNIGINLVLAGRAQEAEEPLRQALELARDLRGPEHPTTINAELAWVDWLVAMGRGAEGVELARSALEHRRGIMDEETALVGYGRSTLGAALAQAGETEEAREELLQARAILEAAAPRGDPMARRNERRIQALGVARGGGGGAESGDRATGASRL